VGELWSVAYGNAWYVAFDNDNATVWRSDDAWDYTEYALPMDFAGYDVVYANGIFIAVGDDDDGSGLIIRSTDGVTWTSTTLTTSAHWFYAVNYDATNDVWLAVGGRPDASGMWAWSTDNGVTWTEGTPSLPSNLYYAYGVVHSPTLNQR